MVVGGPGGCEASRLNEVDLVVQLAAVSRDVAFLALEPVQEQAELGVGKRRHIGDLGERAHVASAVKHVIAWVSVIREARSITLVA